MTLINRKQDNKEHRYYLLPGMGRANRKKRQLYFRCAILVGIGCSLLVGGLLWFLNRM